MTRSGYEITHVRPEHRDEALEVLRELWPYDRATAASLYRWKYLENPYADRPLGIVALHRGRVVGFRGYLADRFAADGHAVGVLHPGDTCVAPAHRNKGLSVAMGKLAMEYDTGRYRLFMNLSCNGISLPGYLALGFRPLAKRVLLQRHGRSPLRWLVAAASKYHCPASMSAREPRSGRFGPVLATDSARPADMAAVIATEPGDGGVLRPEQDECFFAWRYRNPMRRYMFYYSLEGESVRGYLVIGVAASGRCGRILDYGERSGGVLRELLAHVCGRADFMALTVSSYGVDSRLGAALSRLGFTAVHSAETLLRKGSAAELALPVLIRPTGQSFGEAAFAIGALDMRNFDAWRLKPICSDGA